MKVYIVLIALLSLASLTLARKQKVATGEEGGESKDSTGDAEE